MHPRFIGRSKRPISPIGLGAMSFSGTYGATTQKDCFELLDCAREWGVNHIDTSNIYGMGLSEKIIGHYLSQHPKAQRDHFHIATKAGISRDRAKPFDNSPTYLETQLDQSLGRLGIEQVGLFYVHRRETERPIEEVTETLVRLQEKGKIAAFGFSEIAPTSLARASAIHPVAAVQSEYSLQTRSPQLGLLQACQRHQTSFIAFSPVGRGLLTDRPPSSAKVQNIPLLRKNPRFSADNLIRNIKATEPFRALASDLGLSAAGLAISWILAQGKHIIAIPGTRQPKHLRDLILGAQLKWSPEIEEAIKTILPIGWCHGDRYSTEQWIGPERYC